MKKLSQMEFIDKALSRAKRPIDLSMFVYVNSSTKGVAICPTHGEFLISPNALMNRIGCPHCALIERSYKRRMTHEEFIVRATERHGEVYDYSLVKYEGSQGRVRIICPTHGEFSQSANAHIAGQGCPKCGNERVGLRVRLSQDDFVSQARKIHGDRYDLSEAIYLGRTKKITVICKDHGAFYPTAGNFGYLGSGCPACGRARVGAKSRKPLSHYVVAGAKRHLGRYGYSGLFYEDATAYLKIICPEHGEFTQIANDHLKGVGCEKCARPIFNTSTFINAAKKIHNGKYGYDKVRYSGATDKVIITCPNHGDFTQTPNMHANMAQGCPRCAKVGPSTGQLEIFDFLNKYSKPELGFKIGRKELDVFIAEKNIAVEYHGLIWHSSMFQKDLTRDFKKHQIAAAMGIRVIHVYQDEWEQKRPIVEKILLNAIGFRDVSIFARCTSVRPIDESEASKFYAENHIQGAVGAPCATLGLFSEQTLVAAMSFSRITSMRGRARSNSEYELRRYATSTNVVGGASKLLKAFVRATPECSKIISYSDNRMFAGGMYAQLGFVLDHVSKPSYSYVTSNSRLGRMPKSRFRRNALASMPGFTFDPSMSERDNCAANGYYQIHDCGKTRWVLTL